MNGDMLLFDIDEGRHERQMGKRKAAGRIEGKKVLSVEC